MSATRKPPMKVYSNLPDEDLEALVSYMLRLTANQSTVVDQLR